MSSDLKKLDHADLQIDEQTTARVVESLVLKGDISALSPEERTRFYLQICESLGLTPGTLPFAVLKLNGKEILYPTRGATDQLAAMHRLNREIVDGPRVVDLAGTKMLFAVCRATHPNGRIETAIATVPLNDPTNAMMKVETKAKRRATLSILGLGMLDESELDTVPAHLKQRAPYQDTTPMEPPDVLTDFYKRITEIELPGEAVAAWIGYRTSLAALPTTDREAAWLALCKRTEEVGKMKDAKAWLLRAITEEQSRRDAEAWSTRIAAADGRALLAMASEIAALEQDGPKGAYAARWADLIEGYDDATLPTVIRRLEKLPASLRESDVWDPVVDAIERRQKTVEDAEDMGAPTLAEEGAST